MRTNHRMPGADTFGTARGETFVRPVGIATPPGDAPPLPYRSVTDELAWGINDGRTVTVNTPRSKGLIGTRMTQPFDAGGVELQVTEARNEWGVLLATRIDPGDFTAPGRVLVTALGQVENTGQKWHDDAKTTLGRDWGGPPTVAEGIGAHITLPVAPRRARAWALDERGNRREEVPVTGDTRATVDLNASYRTLWYEIDVMP